MAEETEEGRGEAKCSSILSARERSFSPREGGELELADEEEEEEGLGEGLDLLSQRERCLSIALFLSLSSIFLHCDL